MVRLRHVASIASSSVDKKSHVDEIPVRLCNYTDVYKSDEIRPGEHLMRATATREEIDRFRLAVGDTVITKDSEDPRDIGIAAFIPETADDFVCAYHLAVIRPGRIDPKFLYWSMRGRRALDHMSIGANGMTRFGLTLDTIKDVPVPEFSMADQRRIADFLDDRVACIDKAVAARRAQVKLLEEMAESRLADIIEGAETAFGTAPLRRFAAGIEQGWSPSCASAPAEPAEAGVIKLGAVRWGDFRPDENKAMLPGTEPDERYRLREGDLLVTRANTPLMVGDAAVVRLGGRSRLYLSDLVYRVKSEADPEFVSAALRARRTRQLLAVLSRGTSHSMVKLRGEDILDLTIPDCPLEEQLRIGSASRRLRTDLAMQRRELASSVELLAEYKQSLVTAAVSGELDVTTASREVPA